MMDMNVNERTFHHYEFHTTITYRAFYQDMLSYNKSVSLLSIFHDRSPCICVHCFPTSFTCIIGLQSGSY